MYPRTKTGKEKEQFETLEQLGTPKHNLFSRAQEMSEVCISCLEHSPPLAMLSCPSRLARDDVHV